MEETLKEVQKLYDMVKEREPYHLFDVVMGKDEAGHPRLYIKVDNRLYLMPVLHTLSLYKIIAEIKEEGQEERKNLKLLQAILFCLVGNLMRVSGDKFLEVIPSEPEPEPEPVIAYECPTCSASFDNPKSLRGHCNRTGHKYPSGD